MSSASADLNGSGTQEVYLSVTRGTQSQSGNYSPYSWVVRYYGNGYGSYTGNTQYWSANIGGTNKSGTFTIPYANRLDTYTTLGSGTINKTHDSEGYLDAFSCSASINTDHSSIGDGTVTFTQGAPPRIPKRPSVPGAPTFSEATPTSVRVSWTASTDNGGSTIDGYLLRRREVVDGSYTNISQTNDTSRVVEGLTVGKTYVWSVYAHNGSADNGGYSNQTSQESFTQPAGVYFIDPETDIAEVVTLYAWTGAGYELVVLNIDPDLTGDFVPAG